LREREAPTGGERGWVLFYDGLPVGGEGKGGGLGWERLGWGGQGIGEWVLGWVLGCCEWERHGSRPSTFTCFFCTLRSHGSIATDGLPPLLFYSNSPFDAIDKNL